MRKLWKRAAALVVSAALAGAMLPSAFSEEATDAVEAKLATMTLREKVGQLFWVRPETLDFSLNPEKKTLTQTMRQNLEQYPVGGIAVFKKNIQDENQLSSLIADFQSASKIPMIVAVDEEGGAVARLANHEAFSLPKYTSARDIGKTGDPEQARQMGRTIGGYLRFYGFNLDFAPVADDAGVGVQRGLPGLIVGGDFVPIEIVERPAESLLLVQHALPRKPGLEAL